MKNRWILWLLIIFFLWVFVSRFTEIEKLTTTLSQGKWEWVLAAILVQVIYFIVFTASYQAAFAAVELKSRLRDLLPVLFGSLFVNVVVPTGGAGGAALFIDDAVRRGQSSSRVSTGLLLQLIADYIAFTFVLVIGMIYLFIQHDLKSYEIVTALILLFITLGLTTVMLMGVWNLTLLRRLLSWVERLINSLAKRFKRPLFFVEGWATKQSQELAQAASAILKHPTSLAKTLFFTTTAHLFDILCLYTLFLAFHESIKIGPLVAGYSMGILFWIVSITPQGIGVVEGVMALVYTSLGIPSAAAATISLAFRGISFWLPLMVGFIMLQRVKTFHAEQRSLAESWKVRLVALITVLMGIINLLSAVTPALINRWTILKQISPLYVTHGGHLTAALSGFALLLLSTGLWRRKRTAWELSLGILVISIISHLIKGLDYEEAILAAVLAVFLILLGPQFHARSDRPSIRQGIQALLAALLFSLAYGTLGFYLLDRHYSINFGLGAALRQTVVMFTQFYDPGLQPITGFGRYFADSIYMVSAVTLGFALWMLLRPVLLREPATDEQRKEAERIVQAYGRSSLARLVLFDDKAYFFSQAGSVIAYTVRQRVGLALGDPIGPAEDAFASIQGFINFCHTNDWIPAFYQTLPDYLAHYQHAGLDVLCTGQEGIVELRDFSIEGKSNKGLRSAVNRLTKTGYHFEIHQPPLADSLMTELQLLSDEWLSTMHGSEKRFSLGWFDDAYIRNAPVASIRSTEGRITAFANIVPEYQLNEITIDLMRHRKEIEPGTMDFLFFCLFEWARKQGFETFNLGLSALYGVGEKVADPLPERTLHFIYEHINQFYNFKGLHEFKDKFHPRWEPRYLIYQGVANLPAVALAIAAADAGEGGLLSGFFKKFPHPSALPTAHAQ